MKSAEKSDVAVIGAGLAGLCLGALLAEEGGKRALILEAGRRAGGRTRVIEKDGFLLDWGVHALLLGDRSSIVEVLRRIGARPRIRGAGMVIAKGRGRKQIIGATPLRSLGFNALGARDALVVLRALLRTLGNARRAPDVSVAEWLEREGAGPALEALLKTMSIGLLATRAYDRASMKEIVRFLAAALKTPSPLGYPDGGWKSLLNPLEEYIKSSENVTLLTGRKVTEIKLSGSAVKGVVAGGTFYPARIVVAALPVWETLKLLPDKTLPEEFVRTARGMRPTAGVSIDLALRRKISSEKRVIAALEPPSLAWFVSNVSPSIAPEGRQLLTLFSPLMAEELSSNAAVGEAFDRLEGFYFHNFPQLQKNILWKRRMKLIVTGAELNTECSLKKRPGIEATGVKGLCLAGDTVGVPGAGGEIAARSAIECFTAISS
ncbi:MAG: FAD-dependent oxidoreductase [bacterium]